MSILGGIQGIGSGMDVRGMVDALVQSETAPKAAQLQRQSSAAEAEFSALGRLNSALGSFKSAMEKLNDVSLFDNMKATSSNTSAVSVSSEKEAIAGKYSVEVEQLAMGSRVATVAIDSEFKTSGAGSLDIRLGDDEAVTVNIADGASLIQVRDAINEQLAEQGISANVVNNPSTGVSQLVLSSSETGADRDINVFGSDSLDAFSISATDKAEGTGSGYLQQAQNAKYSIDGLQLESASNTVKNAIPDVEFTLKAETEENKPVTVSVGQDTGGVKALLNDFVKAYNEFTGVTKQLTAVTPVGEGKEPVVGALVGDASVRNLVNAVRREMSSAMPGSDGLRVLADLGITTDKDGKLVVDDKKLDTALEQNFDKVGQFFAGDNGLMSRLDGKIDSYAGKGGIIDIRQKSLDQTRSSVTEQREKLEMRAAQIEARYLKQFNAMDALVGQLSSTSSALMQSLASLPGMSNQ